MSNEQTHNQVRQVLMNELGLTREIVRGMMEDIVYETVAKHFKNLESRGVIERIVRDEINRIAQSNGNGFDNPSIRKMVQESAKEQITQFINDRIRIDA